MSDWQPGPFEFDFASYLWRKEILEMPVTDSARDAMNPYLALQRMKIELDAMGPYPKALWFVDQPAGTVAALMHRLEASGIELRQPGDMYVGNFRGLPVYEASAQDITDLDRKEGRWFLLVPGVWCEMSDGKHALIKFD